MRYERTCPPRPRPQWAGGPEHSRRVKIGQAAAKVRYETTRGAHHFTPPCPVCGERFVMDGYTGRWRTYCSNACRQKAYRRRQP